MKAQEIFNRVVAGLASQGFKRSVVQEASGATVCMYRGAGGLKCAVGHLITDEVYHSDLERQSCDFPAVLDALRESGITPLSLKSLQMLREMQETHDSGSCMTPEQFLDAFSRIAKAYKLKPYTVNGEG